MRSIEMPFQLGEGNEDLIHDEIGPKIIPDMKS